MGLLVSRRKDWIHIYGKYLIVGAIVGVLTILVREAIAAILPGDTPVFYALSASSAYLFGILASYYGHRKVSFSHAKPVGGLMNSLGRFTLIAILGLITTTVLSIFFRYGLPFEKLLGRYEPTFAFAFATFVASVLTYSLNATYTFVSREPTPRQSGKDHTNHYDNDHHL